MSATVLTIKEGMTVLQQVKKELARVIDLFLSDEFQEIYLDMCEMLMNERWLTSAKIIKASRKSS